MGMFDIYVDTRELDEQIRFVRSRLSEQQMKTVMRRVYRRTGSHVKTIVKRDVTKHYEVGAGEVGKSVGKAKISGLACTIPITGPRRLIGTEFKAQGSARGWESLRKKYKVKAKIVKGKWTVTKGNNFRNIPSKLGTQSYMRFGGSIKKTLGPAIPQMTTHLAKPDVEQDVINTVSKRLSAELNFILS